MKAFLEEYGYTIVVFIIASALILMLYKFTFNSEDLKAHTPTKSYETSISSEGDMSSRTAPVLEIENGTILEGSDIDNFNPMEYVSTAKDADGKDISNKVKVEGVDKINTSVRGVYYLTFSVRDRVGLSTQKKATFLVD